MEKSKSVNVRFTESERLEIERIAGKLNISMSDVIRKSFEIHDFDDELINEFDKIYRYFNQEIGKIECNNVKIGNNINQITKIYNQRQNVKDVEKHFNQFKNSFDSQNKILNNILIELEKLNKRR